MHESLREREMPEMPEAMVTLNQLGCRSPRQARSSDSSVTRESLLESEQ